MPTMPKSTSSSYNKWIWIVLLVAVLFGYPQPPLKLEEDILPLMRNYTNTNNNDSSPLKGVKVAITGATSGIGLALSQQLAELGATVIVLGRSPQKLAQLQQDLSEHDVVPIQVQLDDLESVQRAAHAIWNKFDSLDALINCAGTTYFNEGLSVQMTPQGIEKSFGVNYLSHFLLTEQLIPLLHKSQYHPTVLQITSSFHFAVDGSDLIIDDSNPTPIAATADAFRWELPFFKWQRAYATSKLAQIWHARALQRRHPTLRVKNVCPAWVATKIANEYMQTLFLNHLAYPNKGHGIKSSLVALFDLKDEGDFFMNSGVFLYNLKLATKFPFFTSWAYKLRLRDVFMSLEASILLPLQRFYPLVQSTTASPESYDVEKQESLYQWSLEAVRPYLELPALEHQQDQKHEQE